MEQLIPLLMVFALVFALGFGVGYGVRELKSQRRRGTPLGLDPLGDLRRRLAERLGRLGQLMPNAKPVNPKPSKDRRVADRPNDRVPALADRGVDKHLADRARKVAAKSEASSAPRASFVVRPPGTRPRRGGGHG